MGLPVATQLSSSTHGGAPITFSAITKAGGQFILRQEDTFTCPTHGTVTIDTASTSRKDLDGKFIARCTGAEGPGSLLSCGGVLTGGDPTVMVN
jgi:uncharacterized Zn-binding protein involved in type VI secretion